VKLTTRLQLVSMSKICGSIHPLPHTPSWGSTKLVKHRENFALYLYYKADVRIIKLFLIPYFCKY
jgi:hypothetical protein